MSETNVLLETSKNFEFTDSNINKFGHELDNKQFLVYLFDRCNGLFTLPDTDTDPDPCTDIHPKNECSNNWGFGSGSESKSKSVRREQFLYSTM